jgi:hypothetical protein
MEQLPSTPEQLVVLLLPLQLIEPPPAQFAATTQRDFSPRIAGRFAAVTGAGPAREARKALSSGAPCGTLAAVAGGTRKIRQARIIENPRTIFFMMISFVETMLPFVEGHPFWNQTRPAYATGRGSTAAFCTQSGRLYCGQLW